MISRILISIFFCLAFFSGCSGSSPAITEVRYRLTAFQDRQRGRTDEYLSVAILAADEDGQDDFESVSLIHDEGELYWQASQDEWAVRQARQQSWIVLEKIISREEFVPRGLYRVIIRDYSGLQAESSFTLTVPREMPEGFPALEPPAEDFPEEADGSLFLSGSRGESVLMIRSAAGALLGSFILKEGENPRAAILANEQIRAQAKDLYLWKQGAANTHFLLAGPWPAEEFLFSARRTLPEEAGAEPQSP